MHSKRNEAPETTPPQDEGATLHHPLYPEDAPIVAAMRQASSAQKGKIFGSRARGPFDAMKVGVPAVPEVATEPGVVGGVAGWWCRPRGARTGARLLYLHGGAFVLGSAGAFRNQASHLARITGADTFVPDYRLAPENPFPAAVDDAWAVYLGLTEGASRVAVAGDSAGGGLTLGVLAAAAARARGGLLQPCGAAVLSPWVDLSLAGESMETRAEADPIFTREVLASFVNDYLQGGDPRDPRVSPLFGSLAGLAPVRIDVGEDEILLDDSLRYAARARSAGVAVTLAIWAGMPHTFQSAVGKLRAAGESLEAAGRFLAARLDATR